MYNVIIVCATLLQLNWCTLCRMRRSRTWSTCRDCILWSVKCSCCCLVQYDVTCSLSTSVIVWVTSDVMRVHCYHQVVAVAEWSFSWLFCLLCLYFRCQVINPFPSRAIMPTGSDNHPSYMLAPSACRVCNTELQAKPVHYQPLMVQFSLCVLYLCGHVSVVTATVYCSKRVKAFNNNWATWIYLMLNNFMR